MRLDLRRDSFPRNITRPAARRAQAIVLTRCDQVASSEVEAIRDWLIQRIPGKPVATTEHRPIGLIGGPEPEAVDTLRGRAIGAFCGIGNPKAFRGTLEALGARVVEFRQYADHHCYSRRDVDDLSVWAERLPREALLATTQKDWVKLRVPEIGNRPLRAVRIGLAFQEGQSEFDETLRRVAPQSDTAASGG